MTAALTPVLALDFVRELSADVRAAWCSTRTARCSPARPRGRPGVRPARGGARRGGSRGRGHDRRRLRRARRAPRDRRRHGPLRLSRLTRHDLRTALAALAGGTAGAGAAATLRRSPRLAAALRAGAPRRRPRRRPCARCWRPCSGRASTVFGLAAPFRGPKRPSEASQIAGFSAPTAPAASEATVSFGLHPSQRDTQEDACMTKSEFVDRVADDQRAEQEGRRYRCRCGHQRRSKPH